ncbi:ig-like domain-containing protein [Trichonephila clavipes]|nr:ig-like domain-containing protein [Trichonephila clavipes]
MGAAMPNVLQPGSFVRFQKTRGSLSEDSTSSWMTVDEIVGYTPTCKPNQRDLFGVAREEVVNITCEVDSDPQDVTFRWTLNNSVENTELHTFESSGAMSVLTYTPKTPMDYGAVQCLGRNSVGEQKEPCVVRIIPAGKNLLKRKKESPQTISMTPSRAGKCTNVLHPKFKIQFVKRPWLMLCDSPP